MQGSIPVKRPRGRPHLDESVKRIKKSISLYPKIVEFARELGDGVASTGIERATAEYRLMNSEETQENLKNRPSGLVGIEVVKTSVSLTPETLDLLIVVGDGVLSQGIAEILQVVMGARQRKA
jgi:hypothetical protein